MNVTESVTKSVTKSAAETARVSGVAYVTLFAASLGFAIVQLDVTIVNVALPTLHFAAGSSVAFLQWIVDAYTLPFACLLLSAGAAAARFGAKRIYMTGLLLFALASLACAMSSSPAALIVARCAQGSAAALLVPPSLMLIHHAFLPAPRARAFALAVWSATGGVAIAAGPLIGSVVIRYGGWREIFAINLPLCVLAMVCTARVPEAVTAPGRRLDLAGQACAIVCMVCLIAGIIEAGAKGIADPVALAALTASAVFAGLFVRVERRAREPLLPPALLRVRGFGYPTLIGMVMNGTYFGMLFVLTLYLQSALRYTATQAALAYLPLTATFVVSNLVSGWLVGVVGGRVTMAFGAAIAMGGFLLLAAATAHRDGALFVPFVLIPAGIGLAIPAITSAVMSSVDETYAAVASAAMNAARQVAGAIGVAAFGALVSGAGDAGDVGLGAACLIAAVLQLCAVALALVGLSGRTEPVRDVS